MFVIFVLVLLRMTIVDRFYWSQMCKRRCRHLVTLVVSSIGIGVDSSIWLSAILFVQNHEHDVCLVKQALCGLTFSFPADVFEIRSVMYHQESVFVLDHKWIFFVHHILTRDAENEESFKNGADNWNSLIYIYTTSFAFTVMFRIDVYWYIITLFTMHIRY